MLRLLGGEITSRSPKSVTGWPIWRRMRRTSASAVGTMVARIRRRCSAMRSASSCRIFACWLACGKKIELSVRAPFVKVLFCSVSELSAGRSAANAGQYSVAFL